MLVASLSSCHMLWYLHLCAQAKITVLAYRDDAEGTMTEDEGGGGRFTAAVLRPVATIAAGGDAVRATALHEEAHRQIKATKSSRFRGVFWNSRTQSWQAQIMHRYRLHHLGFFTDEMKAAAAYDLAAMKLHEHRAKLNFSGRPRPAGPTTEGHP